LISSWRKETAEPTIGFGVFTKLNSEAGLTGAAATTNYLARE
jgi:hypothetical protein